ncbi:CheB methylesterase domain-containing protein [Thalassobaculum salexigens]|mgnify:CR=1 FL=1|uniref:CheB methylesterase domain-containing protein n=1 Tax=Thalassobaculum salexigens TaxID=455360 RepID=UPI00248DC47E|nr:CheB methylesterase domain-containing protein [Thalassobaculum salexigens]
MSSLRVVVVAADPLLRKAVSESLNDLKTLGEVTAVTPTRATPDRMTATDAVLIVGTDADARTLKPAVAAAIGAGRPIVFVTVGEGGAPALLALGTPGTFSVKVADLDIRAQLASAAPKIADLLRRAEAAQVPAADPASATATGPTRAPAVPRPVAPGAPYLGVVICIGASTGGTDALLAILSKTPRTSPPIVIVQHMPEAYVGDFAARLDRSSPLDVSLAQDDLPLRMGLAVVAPGGRQLRLRKDAKGIWTRSGETGRFGGHCPAVDVLMNSAAEQLGKRAIGVVLTGMGRDGADGLLAMREAGARTVAQDEATSIVYGMPKAAFENGGADTVLPLGKVADFVSGLVMSFR